MPRRKKTRHGATQPEEERAARQVKLRLPPESIAQLRALAAMLGVTMSQAVILLLAGNEATRRARQA